MSDQPVSPAPVQPLVLQNGIFVAGHPRSGTSLACQLLESAGVKFPSDFGGDQYNKAGYFELASGKELEKALIDEAMTERTIPELNRIVSRLNGEKGLTGLKIVHIPALFFYRHVAKNIRVVFVFRHPADTRASMLHRGISQFKLNWFDNNNALIAAHENIKKSIVISYETLLAGGPGVARAFAKLGFKIDPAVIRKEQRTQKQSHMIVRPEEEEVYRVLRKLEKKSLA
ncbi:MAG TPA: hypothetical protein PKK12_10455 [Candidatus Aminicenantes bacterium]|nr:hypothetical protein [Candidatus Aminicenantes bacterium]